MDTGLLALRVVVGLVLFGHGARKLFGWFGGGGLTAAAWFFRLVGYRSPRLMAGLAGGAELVGGAAFVVGLGTPLGAAAVMATMLNAVVAVHRRNGRLVMAGGYAYPLGIAPVVVSLGFTGAGTVSLDGTLGLGHGGVASGLFALALGLAAGSAVLLSRAALPEARPASRWSPSEKMA